MSYYNIFSPQKSPNLSPKRRREFKLNLNWKKIGKIIGIIFGAGLLFVAGIFLYFAKDLPSPGKINTRFIAESTKIYDRTGNHILYDIHGEEKRTIIPLNEIPDSVKYATIVLEDQDFYSHAGIKLTSIIRALLKDVLHQGIAQGGSTITQQFIKNSVLSPERTLTRKIKEVILSLELEQKFSKDEILGMYLNEIPYGSNAYGIEAAAQTFFGKHARELSLDEAALIASLPQAPSFYSPFGSRPEELKARQEFTLNKLASLGYITPEEAQAAIDVNVLAKINPQQENISAPHFVMYVKEYLEKNYGQALIEKGGLKVYTTLDWDKQQIAEQAVREGAEKNTKSYNASNASLVALDPKSGQILAMVGSKDFFGKSEPEGCIAGKTCKFESQVNVAVRERQPGSSFKPYVYLTAFKKGYTPETLLWDVDTNFDTGTGKDYNPKNYDGKNRGPLKMKEALAMSLNVPAVKTLYLAGVKNSLDTAKSMGITSLTDPNRVGLSLVLGGGEVKLLDHVNAFATLATGGVYREKTAILKIQDSAGSVLEEFKANPGERVVEEKYVAMLDYILSTNDLRKPVFGENSPLRFDERPVAAKTGTTNEWRDGWTVGYTPSLAVGVWAGNNDNSPMTQGADGVFTAAPIFRKFMDQTLKNYNIEQFPKYEKEETGKPILDGTLELNEKISVCEISKGEYCLATDACPESTRKEKTFFTGHDTLWYVKKDDPRGDAPKNPKDDPQFNNWEKAVQKWVKKDKDYSSAQAPENKCQESDFKDYLPSVKITSPDDKATVSSSPLTIKASLRAGFGLKRATLYVNGEEITTKDSLDFSYDYPIPDSQKNADLEIKIEVLDKNDNSASSTIRVAAAIL
jgi:1A family penicillin-binding protein